MSSFNGLALPAQPADGTEVPGILLKTGVGILVGDAIFQRLVESAAFHLQLTPVLLQSHELKLEILSDLELIVADSSVAATIRNLLSDRSERAEGIDPAVIAVVSGREEDRTAPDLDQGLDGILTMPQSPAAVSAQLSLILYAHRAFAKRYQSAIEELHLNRRIFRSVTSGISVANATLPDMPLTYVNPAFEVMTGYSLEEVQGKNCRFLQGEERSQPALTLIREALTGQREATAILKNFRKDGTAFWNELALSPIRNREGELTHFVGIQTDVTARVEFELALRESEKLAAVGRLASAIAHEINNPLEAVMNLIYIAQRMNIPDEARDVLATADNELERVKHITAQSLRFYKQSTKAQAVGCTELLESVLQLYRARFLNAHVTVQRRERSTQSIICMESEIRQVLSNLISNAVDAMRTEGGRLLIRTREATDWRSQRKGITLTFADTGTGMSPDVVANIYKAFYTTKGHMGTGLGLWISSEIVERHNGRLLVRSRQTPRNAGTVFQLFLPYQAIS